MKKIPTIFVRNAEQRNLVPDEVNPDCMWVFNGEGVATKKYDGTCCMMNCGILYKRREIKPGKDIPEGFIQEDHDSITGKTVGWMRVGEHDKWHLEVLDASLPDGTYELVGPKIQGNPEGYNEHTLISHNEAMEYDVRRHFKGIKYALLDLDIEGFVFHHPDGRMAKIKKKDFGLKR